MSVNYLRNIHAGRRNTSAGRGSVVGGVCAAERACDERLERIVEPNERRGVEAHPSRQQLGVISRK